MHTSVRGSQEALTSSERIAESILELRDEPDGSDKRWRAPIFRRLPERIAENAAYNYKETYIFEGRHDANLHLLETFGKSTKYSIPLNATDGDLQALSKRIVVEIKDFSNFLFNSVNRVASLKQYAQKFGLDLHVLDHPAITLKGLFTRLTDENWWLRRLRKAYARKLEQHARDIGLVHHRKGSYVSDETLQRRREQRKRNQRC